MKRSAEKEKTIIQIHLYECGHIWQKDEKGNVPDKCPVCETEKWATEAEKLIEQAAEEIENCYGKETELSKKMREFLGGDEG